MWKKSVGDRNGVKGIEEIGELGIKCLLREGEMGNGCVWDRDRDDWVERKEGI